MSESSRPSELFPERLRAARDLRKLNQGELATKAGLQPSWISHFETGARKPSFDNLLRLAEALKVTTDYLLGRVDDVAAYASANKLHRHIELMSDSDRELTEHFVEMLAAKAKKTKPSE